MYIIMFSISRHNELRLKRLRLKGQPGRPGCSWFIMTCPGNLSDSGLIYCAGGREAHSSPIFRCTGTTMRLDIVNLCARSSTMLATITQIRQATRVISGSVRVYLYMR